MRIIVGIKDIIYDFKIVVLNMIVNVFVIIKSIVVGFNMVDIRRKNWYKM